MKLFKNSIAVIGLFAIVSLSCTSKKTGDNSSVLENKDLLSPEKLSSGVWVCNSQLSDLYITNNVSVTTYLLFTDDDKKGTIEVCEGSGLSRSCICNGKYSLGSDKKSLSINDISSSNCYWMKKLNSNYLYDAGNETLSFNIGNESVTFKHEFPE